MVTFARVEIQVGCISCFNNFPVVVNPLDIELWNGGELIQDAFPYLTDSERELLISHVCENCFDKMFEGCEE